MERTFDVSGWVNEKLGLWSDDLGISQSEVVALAVDAFSTYGIALALDGADYKDNDFKSYSELLAWSAYDGEIKEAVIEKMRSCADCGVEGGRSFPSR